MRVHELAKELGMSSKELIDRLGDMGVSVKGHMSALEDEVMDRVRSACASKPASGVASAKASKLQKSSRREGAVAPSSKTGARTVPKAEKPASRDASTARSSKPAARRQDAGAGATTARPAASGQKPAAPLKPIAPSKPAVTPKPGQSVKSASASKPAGTSRPAAPTTPASSQVSAPKSSKPTTAEPKPAPSSAAALPQASQPKPAPTVVQKPALPSAQHPASPSAQRPAPPAAPKAAPTGPAPSAAPQAPKAAGNPTPAAGPSATPAAKTPPQPVAPKELKPLQIDPSPTVKEFSVKLGIGPSELIKRLIQEKVFATINQPLGDWGLLERIAESYGFLLEQTRTEEQLLLSEHEVVSDPSRLAIRPPVVTFMGHVDHGKTSLLDYIRKTKAKIVDRESGGITQHIGAYSVSTERGSVTFLDTPGHAAFTAMRARGAELTDVVVLVVAADDGVMPQTIEAINHAKAAGVPIVVAINKCDLPHAQPDKVKQGLMQHELVPEEWGGKTIMVQVSAKTGAGIDTLLEMLALEAEMLELKADPTRPARGVVIEGRLSPRGGPLATVIAQEGTLRAGDIVICGEYWGRLRALLDDHGHRVPAAPPAVPVEVLGLSGVPEAGETFYVVQDERKARSVVESRQFVTREQRLSQPTKRMTFEQLHDMIAAGETKEFPIILKADVQGSLEAVSDALLQIDMQEVKLSIIHQGVGLINESDIMLADVAGAVVIGFHVGVMAGVDQLAQDKHIDVRRYEIIYELLNDVRSVVEGMLDPHEEKVFLGRAEVLQTFKVTKAGAVAGCRVVKGKIHRSNAVRVLRGDQVLFEGKMASLKRFKDDVREVNEGMECGISVEGFGDPQPGDMIEALEVRRTARQLK